MGKREESFEIDIEEDGKTYTGTVQLRGSVILYPTVIYGRRSIKGNSFKASDFDSLVSYCKVILLQLVREELKNG